MEPFNNNNRGGGEARTVAEELERTEQSITLTLQEIDRNFAVANRIVAESILPTVERYGQECRGVWNATKFWKQFFETSANVSLSGYEELAEEGDDVQVNYHQRVDGDGGDDETTTNTTTSAIIRQDAVEDTTHEHYHQENPTIQPKKEPLPLNVLNSSSFESTYEQSNSNIIPPPKPMPSLKSYYPQSDTLSSPPDTPPSLSDATQAIFSSKRPAGGGRGLLPSNNSGGDSSQSISVSTPPAITSMLKREPTGPSEKPKRPVETIFHALSLDNQSTPPMNTIQTQEDSLASFVSQKTPGRQNQSDKLLHHVLDKSWRLQVTPLKPQDSQSAKQKSKKPRRKSMAAQKYDDLASSSPPDVSPGLMSQVFSNNNYQQKGAANTTTPSVKRHQDISSSIDIPPTTPRPSERYSLMYGDDDDEEGKGYGLLTEPQFTPARQAAHLMVDNLLDTVRTATTREGTTSTLHPPHPQDPATMTSFLTDPSSLTTAATSTTTAHRRDEDDVFN